jgi:hypothetical protein
MAPADHESGDGAKPAPQVTRIPKNSRELANYYLEMAYRTENHISTTRLPSLLMSLALSVFAAGATLRVYEAFWFKGDEFIGFALFATALLAAGVVVHIAELNLPRKGNRADIAAQNGTGAHDGDQEDARTEPQVNSGPGSDATAPGR